MDVCTGKVARSALRHPGLLEPAVPPVLADEQYDDYHDEGAYSTAILFTDVFLIFFIHINSCMQRCPLELA